MFATLYECSTHGLVIASYGCCVCASLRRDCYVRLLSDHERVSEACVPWRSGRFDPDGHILPRGPPRCQQIAENPWYHCVTIRYKAPSRAQAHTQRARTCTHAHTHPWAHPGARTYAHAGTSRGQRAYPHTHTRGGAYSTSCVKNQAPQRGSAQAEASLYAFRKLC